MTARRTLAVKGRQGVHVTVGIEVYRGKVWVITVDQALTSEAIFEPAQVDRLMDVLAQAATEARGGTKDQTP